MIDARGEAYRAVSGCELGFGGQLGVLCAVVRLWYRLTMVKYEVTTTGPKRYQVTATNPDVLGIIVDDFATLTEAELFANAMLAVDAAAVPGDGKTT